MRFFLMIGFCVCAMSITAQEKLVKNQLQSGDSLYAVGDYSQALSSYLIANEEYKSTQEWKEWYYSLKGICKVKMKTNSANFLIDSIPLFIDIIPSDNHYIRGASYSFLAYALTSIGRGYPSIPNYEKSIAENKIILDLKDERAVSNLVRIYYNLSIAYSNLGDQKSALKYIDEVIPLCRLFKHKSLCKYYSIKGKYYLHNDQIDEAITQYKMTIDSCGDQLLNIQYLAELYLGIDSLNLGAYYLEKSQKLIDNNSDYDDCYQRILQSTFLEKEGKVTNSIATLKSVIIDECLYHERAKVKQNVKYAQLLFNNDSIASAQEYADKAINYFFSKKDTTNNYSRPIVGKELPDVWIIEALLIKAKYFNLEYINKKNPSLLAESEFYFDLLFSYFDKLKLTYNSVVSQYRIGSYTKEIYSSIIDFYINLYFETLNPEHFERAFSLMQKTNAFVLRNSISERKAFDLYKVSKDSIEQYFSLQNIASNVTNDSLGEIENIQAFNKYEIELNQNYPGLKNFFNSQIIVSEKLQKTLGNNELFVNYFFNADDLFSFVISKNSKKIIKHNIDESFSSLSNDVYQMTSDPNLWNENDYIKKSKSLYDFILKNILEDEDFSALKSLIIVPDGSLKQLPFSALVVDEVIDRLIPSNYLLSAYDLSYLFYAGQLEFKENDEKVAGKYIGFGIEYTDEFLEEIIKEYKSYSNDSNETRSLSLANLVYADDEVISNAVILDGKALTNESVTISSVKENISNFNIAHFSAHALNNIDDYLNSFLVLNRNENDEFRLKFRDIINLNLNNELIVLSACQTGIGERIKGEGTMSLSRAFLQSGAQASLGNYWNAPDKATKELMNLFYSNINKGMSKSKALQKAQFEYLSNDAISSPSVRSPFYWSGWAMYGNNKSISQGQNKMTPIYLGIAIFLFSIISFLFWKKRRLN